VSLVITSKTIRKGDRIQSLKAIAIREAIAEGLIELVKKDVGLFSLTVARKTGKFRSAVQQAVRRVINMLGFQMHSSGKTVISWSDIVDAILAQDKDEYFKYHIRGRGFYKNPTVANTYPLRFSRFKTMAKNILKIKIPIKLKKYRIENRVTFTV